MEGKRKGEKLAIIINTRNISINILISNSILSHDTWSTHDKILCPRVITIITFPYCPRLKLTL